MSEFEASLTSGTAGQARKASKGLAKGRLGLLASIVLGLSLIHI